MEQFRETLQSEAVNIALSKDYGCIHLAVRSGKSRVGLMIAKNFIKALVSYPKVSIMNSWVNEALEIGQSLDNITFTTHLSLNKHNLDEYQVLITDELHELSVNQLEYITSNLPSRWYGLTGTFPDRNPKKKILDIYCPIIYEKKLSETTGITNKDYEIIIHYLKPSDIKDIPKKVGFWSERSKIQFFDNKYQQTHHFSVMIMLIKAISNSKTKFDYLKKLASEMNRGLIFVETTEQCKELGYPAYNTKEPKSEENLEAFQNKEINKLCSISQLQAGITFKDVNECIILHSYSSNSKAVQKLGRILNYLPNVKAKVHILCLKGTRDESWVSNALKDLDPSKISYKQVN